MWKLSLDEVSELVEIMLHFLNHIMNQQYESSLIKE